MKRILFTVLLLGTFKSLNTKIEAYGFKTNPPIVQLKEGESYSFEINSPINYRPLEVHEQNKEYVTLKCKQSRIITSNSTHQCKVTVKPNAPEGTLAVFQKIHNAPNKIIFHISVKKNKKDNG